MLLSILGIDEINAQSNYGDFEQYTQYDLDYLSYGELLNYRTRHKGDKALSLYYFAPMDYSELNSDIVSDSTTIIDNKHRVTERLVPNYRYYLSDKSNLTFGVYFKRSNIKYEGEIDTTITPSLISSEKEQITRTGIYGRVGYDYHLSQPSFRLFDLDFYIGSAVSFGYAPSKSINETEFFDGDYIRVTTKGNSVGFGLDLYGGINFQFDNFSAGVEVIALGFDSNRGVGKTSVKSESSIAGITEDNEYYTYDQNPGAAYSKLNLSRNLTSMYRGIRLSVSYYFQ